MREKSVKFFDEIGSVALGCRIRALAEKITKDARCMYKDYGIDFKPKWYPVAIVLQERNSATITQIAEYIGQTHPSVSVLVKDMTAHGLVTTASCVEDARKTLVSLTDRGKQTMATITDMTDLVKAAVSEIEHESGCDLWKALGQWDAALQSQSLAQRVKRMKEKNGTSLDLPNDR